MSNAATNLVILNATFSHFSIEVTPLSDDVYDNYFIYVVSIHSDVESDVCIVSLCSIAPLDRSIVTRVARGELLSVMAQHLRKVPLVKPYNCNFYQHLRLSTGIYVFVYLYTLIQCTSLFITLYIDAAEPWPYFKKELPLSMSEATY